MDQWTAALSSQQVSTERHCRPGTVGGTSNPLGNTLLWKEEEVEFKKYKQKVSRQVNKILRLESVVGREPGCQERTEEGLLSTGEQAVPLRKLRPSPDPKGMKEPAMGGLGTQNSWQG